MKQDQELAFVLGSHPDAAIYPAMQPLSGILGKLRESNSAVPGRHLSGLPPLLSLCRRLRSSMRGLEPAAWSRDWWKRRTSGREHHRVCNIWPCSSLVMSWQDVNS